MTRSDEKSSHDKLSATDASGARDESAAAGAPSALDELAELTGLGDAPKKIRAGFAARLAANAARAFAEIAAAGRLVDGAAPPALALPPAFADVLACAIAVEEAERTPRAEALARHYLDYMPRLRVEQLAARAEPAATLLHTPLDWSRLPRISGIFDRLFALLAESGAPPSLLGATSAAALRDATCTLGQLYVKTFYGGFMPLLYGWPADLAFFARALDDGARFESVVDRHLAAPLLHELAHLDPSTPALFPLYLDECVAGHLGVLLLPEFAFPRAGEDDALYAAPWFAQVGQALARVAGRAAIVRAHAGAEPWSRALPSGLAKNLARAGWADYLRHRQPHLLSDGFHPEPWLKLIFFGAAGESLASLDEAAARDWREFSAPEDEAADRAILDDALRAMCLENDQVALHYVVRAAPPRAPIAIDFASCRVSRPAAGAHEPAPPSYLFPPATAARLRARGVAGYTVELDDLAALPEVAALVFEGAPGRRGARFLLHRNMTPPIE